MTLTRTYDLELGFKLRFEAQADAIADKIAGDLQREMLRASGRVTVDHPRVEVLSFNLQQHERHVRYYRGSGLARSLWTRLEPYLDSAFAGAFLYYGATKSSLVGICLGSVIACRAVASWVRREGVS